MILIIKVFKHNIYQLKFFAEIADTNYSAWIGDRGDIQLPVNRLSENSSMEEEHFEWDFEAEGREEKVSSETNPGKFC